MVGALLAGSATVNVKAGSDVLALPSETLTTIPAYAPTSVAAGVPESAPVRESKPAQAGLPETLYVSGSPSGSDPEGRKL